MHIFVADEHPPAVFVYTRRRALQIPPSAGFHDIAYGREKGGRGKRAQMAAVLPFLEGPDLSRSTDESRRHHFGWRRCFSRVRLPIRRRPPSYVTNIEGERPCDHVSPF